MKFLLVFVLCIATVNAKMTALDIMHKVINRPTGDKMKADMTLTLVDKYGKSRVRTVKRLMMQKGEDEWSMLFFLEPSDVKNTAILTYDYDDESKNDDQWMYTPADKKIRRIASSDKSGSFMGTDMNYSDMVTPQLSDYTFTLLKEGTVNDHECWIIQSIPKSDEVIDETGYTKSIAWVRKDNYVVVQAMKYTDREGEIKYMTVLSLEKIENIWVATKTEMKTLRNKEFQHKTIMHLRNISFNNAFDESLFSQPRMRKGL